MKICTKQKISSIYSIILYYIIIMDWDSDGKRYYLESIGKRLISLCSDTCILGPFHRLRHSSTVTMQVCNICPIQVISLLLITLVAWFMLDIALWSSSFSALVASRNPWSLLMLLKFFSFSALVSSSIPWSLLLSLSLPCSCIIYYVHTSTTH